MFMGFKLGDFVRFVDEKREGYVTRIIDAQTLGVTDTDGFEIPVAISNLTHVHGHQSTPNTQGDKQAPIVVDEKLKLGEELFNGVGMCKSCHLPDKKVIGPSIVEIARIYKDKEANMVEFLKENADPIVDPSQYEVMKTNFAITKTMSDDELKAIEAYMYSFLK